MGDFKRGGGFGGPKGGDRGGDRYPKRDFGGRPRFQNNREEARRDFGARPDMHKATCSDCGATCEVPFRPTGDKPVYCNNCFAAHRDGGASDHKKFDKKDFGPKHHDHDRGDRKPDARPGDNSALHDLKRRVDELHAKMDKILDQMNGGAKKATVVVPAKTPSLVPAKIKKDVAAKKEKIEKKSVKKSAPIKLAKAVKKVVSKKKK